MLGIDLVGLLDALQVFNELNGLQFMFNLRVQSLALLQNHLQLHLILFKITTTSLKHQQPDVTIEQIT